MNPLWKGQIEVHAEPVHLYGYRGDTRAETAEIVIPRRLVQDGANDIGFKLQEDGSYAAIISEFDASVRYGIPWRNQLAVQYGAKGVQKLAAKHKWVTETTQRADGGLVMVGRPRKTRF